jgi:predicted amidohydrolase
MTPTSDSSDAVTVAAVQMTSGPEVAANLENAGALLEQAARSGARIALLPENFSFMGLRDADKRAIAERQGAGPVQDFLSGHARELKLWIVAGTTPISEVPGERVAAACLVYDERGERVARYDKMHLFDVAIPGREEKYRESGNVAPGSRLELVPTPAGMLGLSVCYDMRFPEMYRPMSAAGAQWFTMPSAFTVPTGRAHWEALLRARAIENLSFVVAAAQWGRHASGRETYGDSMIIDYWGRVLARLPEGQGVVVATLDLAAQRAARQDFPALSHRVL